MKHTHKLWIALILAGIVGGMVGIALTELMHFIQHTAYGYGMGGGHVSFREGVVQTSSERRILVLILCGVAVGFGWWSLKRFGRPP